jgi:hypothetical protein
VRLPGALKSHPPPSRFRDFLIAGAARDLRFPWVLKQALFAFPHREQSRFLGSWGGRYYPI